MKNIYQVWTVEELVKRKDKINPKPQYQRTSVWSDEKKQLLIDSLLRDYDLPKFYLRETPDSPTYQYEVTDGQQRMRAIWEFCCTTGYSLDQFNINGDDVKDLSFAKIHADHKNLLTTLIQRKLHFTIIKSSTAEDIRILFARLQMGERLIPVELRHAIASNIGAAIQSVINTHDFFGKDCAIPNARYKHQDYLDHVLSIVNYQGQKDVKAVDIRQLYIDHAKSRMSQLQIMLQNTNQVLDYMHMIDKYKKGIFKNKWSFVDMFYLIYSNLQQIKNVKPRNLATNLATFEAVRRMHTREPEALIKSRRSKIYDEDMYAYIIAYKSAGAVKANVERRHQVYKNRFLLAENFNLRKS